jgi:hypothetical protein
VNKFDHFEAHNRPSAIARLAELLCRASGRGSGASKHIIDYPGTPVYRCTTTAVGCRVPPVPAGSQLHLEPRSTVLVVTGNLLLSPRKITAIGDLYRPSGLR